MTNTNNHSTHPDKFAPDAKPVIEYKAKHNLKNSQMGGLAGCSDSHISNVISGSHSCGWLLYNFFKTKLELEDALAANKASAKGEILVSYVPKEQKAAFDSFVSALKINTKVVV